MALGAACRDRARLVPRAAGGERDAEGGYSYSDGPEGTEFRCLYDPGNESETRDNAKVRRSRQASLITVPRDVEGQQLSFDAADRIHITRSAFGELYLEIVGQPTPIVKRRAVIGWEMTVQKVVR